MYFFNDFAGNTEISSAKLSLHIETDCAQEILSLVYLRSPCLTFVVLIDYLVDHRPGYSVHQTGTLLEIFLDQVVRVEEDNRLAEYCHRQHVRLVGLTQPHDMLRAIRR